MSVQPAQKREAAAVPESGGGRVCAQRAQKIYIRPNVIKDMKKVTDTEMRSLHSKESPSQFPGTADGAYVRSLRRKTYLPIRSQKKCIRRRRGSAQPVEQRESPGRQDAPGGPVGRSNGAQRLD